MSHRFLIGIGAAFFAVFALAIAAVISVSTMSDSPLIASKVVPASPVSTATPSVPEVAPTTARPLATAPTLRTTIPSQSVSQATGYTVQDSDIIQLATAVKLGATSTGDVGRDVWVRETPIAERLLQGSCDCDQRNWLNHFVQTGREAMSGSNNYFQSVQLLATLRHSNADLAKNLNLP